MIKTGVMQFGFAPVFYIPKLVEILKDTFITELYMEPEINLGFSGTVEAGTL